MPTKVIKGYSLEKEHEFLLIWRHQHCYECKLTLIAIASPSFISDPVQQDQKSRSALLKAVFLQMDKIETKQELLSRKTKSHLIANFLETQDFGLFLVSRTKAG